MPEVSVLMSIYNERYNDIEKAVNSVLKQTFKDFEFIIVIDEPSRANLASMLEARDPRIKIYLNKENIGLAKSMNRAAELADGKYLARMDADDVSLPQRLEKEYKSIIEEGYSLVCTGYVVIDEKDNEIGMSSRKISDKELVDNLTYDNTIHHPTVMMKKNVFEQAGRYRNFPCSQDYDLWLRMREVDLKMHFIPEILFKYRIRSDSVSQKNKVKQLTTWWYIQKLYNERKKHGKDSFSEENYEEYLRKNKVYNKKYCKDANKALCLKNKIDLIKNQKGIKVKRYLMMLKIFFSSEFYRRYYIHLIKCKLLRNINKICKHIQKMWKMI